MAGDSRFRTSKPVQDPTSKPISLPLLRHTVQLAAVELGPAEHLRSHGEVCLAFGAVTEAKKDKDIAAASAASEAAPGQPSPQGSGWLLRGRLQAT